MEGGWKNRINEIFLSMTPTNLGILGCALDLAYCFDCGLPIFHRESSKNDPP
jgi:hypothetical protein